MGSVFVQEYEYRDLVGNLRLSFKDATIGNPAIRNAPTVVQVVEYDPYGLELKGLGYESTPSPSKFKFTGKESINDFSLGWIDFGARMYDKQIGRWSAIDPLAENGRRWSPYCYAFDNPVRFIDPDGRWPFPSWSELANKAKNYVVNKAVETATNVAVATVNYVKNEVKEVLKNTEVAVYGKAEVKLTTGAGGAAEIKGVGVDARYRHVELLSGGVELDSKKGGSLSGNYASKNGETKEVSNASVGFILEGGYSQETTKSRNGITATKSEIDAGGVYGAIPTPIGALPLGAGVKLSKETTGAGSTYETRAEAARTGAKIGTPFTFSFDASIGVRATYNKKDD